MAFLLSEIKKKAPTSNCVILVIVLMAFIFLSGWFCRNARTHKIDNSLPMYVSHIDLIQSDTSIIYFENVNNRDYINNLHVCYKISNNDLIKFKFKIKDVCYFTPICGK
jgi:hypothetical protein